MELMRKYSKIIILITTIAFATTSIIALGSSIWTMYNPPGYEDEE